MSDEFVGAQIPDSMMFHYIKTSYCREIFVEGVFGGITPRGYISAALFKERQAIPATVTKVVNADGTLGDETGREGKEGIVRMIEANLYLDKVSAQSLVLWLQQKVEELEELEEQQQTLLSQQKAELS